MKNLDDMLARYNAIAFADWAAARAYADQNGDLLLLGDFDDDDNGLYYAAAPADARALNAAGYAWAPGYEQ